MRKSSLHPVPGIRFKPTDAELAKYYLKPKLLGEKLDPDVIADINIYDFSPSDLPAKSILSGDLEWYFFCSQSKKYSSGPRMNRATKTGYWKSTGNDKEVKHKGRIMAMRKTLIFHLGHYPKGERTNWVIYEYKMKDEDLANQGVSQDAYVICKVFKKSGLGPNNGAQYGSLYEEEDCADDDDDKSTVTSIMMVGVLVNPNNASCSSVMNITSTEPGPSTVIPSAFEDNAKVFDPNNASTSGPSTITSSETETLAVTDFLANDDVMLTHGDRALLLSNNGAQGVEHCKEKKVMTFDDDDDDGTDFFQELLASSNLDSLDQDMSDTFNLEKYINDTFVTDDISKELEN